MREIQSIISQNKLNPDLQMNQLAIGDDPTARRKLNIFDHQDANALKNETLAKLGYSDQV